MQSKLPPIIREEKEVASKESSLATYPLRKAKIPKNLGMKILL